MAGSRFEEPGTENGAVNSPKIGSASSFGPPRVTGAHLATDTTNDLLNSIHAKPCLG